MEIKGRNKQAKKILSDIFGRSMVSVTSGRGSSWGWLHVTIKTPDPCPHKQFESPCDSYCNGICAGNNKPIHGGWGDTVRQLCASDIREWAETLLEGVEMTHFYPDMGGTVDCCSIDVEWT